MDHDQLIQRLSATPSGADLSDNDRAYLARVYNTDKSIYRDRLAAVGMSGLGRVLDAGCGFGQWTVQLCSMNARVDAVDVSPARVAIAREIFKLRDLQNVDVHCAGIDTLPFDDETFDGIFCYSVAYLTDWRLALSDLMRCLRPNGLLYLNTNGLGWYLRNFADPRNATNDFDPRQMAIDALANSIDYYSRNQYERGKCIVMPSGIVLPYLRGLEGEIIAQGGDGSTSINGQMATKPFFAGSEFGMESVWEVICRKRERRSTET